MMKYPILQRNLAEIESMIRSIFSESDINRCRLQYVASSDEIERKFLFLKNQFAAEFSTPHADHHLSHLSARFDGLHDAFIRVHDGLLHDQPLGSGYLDSPSACSCTDSCLDDCDDEGEVEDEVEVEDKVEEVDQSGSGVFKAYDNPCWDSGEPEEVEVEDEGRSAVIHEPVCVEKEGCQGIAEPEKVGVRDRGGDCGGYWRGLLIGVLSGAVATVASVLAVVVTNGIRCRFDDGVSGVLFPPPT